MNRHRRAPIFRSASTSQEGQGATVAVPHGVDGSGAPATRRGFLTLLVAAIAALALLIPAAALAAPPALTIESASRVGVTSAVAKGTIDPEGKHATWHFEYVTDQQFTTEGEWAQATSVGSGEGEGSSPITETSTLPSLAPDTTYHLRLVAENEDSAGTPSTIEAATFHTDALAVPALTVEAAGPVGFTEATLHGTVDPEGGNVNPAAPSSEEVLSIIWLFQYREVVGGQGEEEGWSSTGGTVIAGGEAGSGAEAEGNAPIAVEHTLPPGTLHPGKSYEARLLALFVGREAHSAAPFEPFTTKAAAPPTVTLEPVTTFTDSTATFVGHIDPDAPQAEGSTSPDEEAAFETSWHFECVAPGPSCGNLSGTAIPAGNAAKEVTVNVTHLEPNKAYFVQLVATDAGGEGKAVTVQSFTTGALAPTVKTWSAGPVAPTQADINAQVNPNNSPTTYWFEWGTANCENPGCQSIPATKDASAGEGPIFVYVDRHLSGLVPGTTYHFRVVAENAVGITPGPDQTFTTAPAEPACANAGMPGTNFLPDCRGWELVSPPGDQKNGTDVVPDSFWTYAAEEGEGVAWPAINGFGDARGATVAVQYLSRRTGAPGTDGWSSHAITPPGHAPGILPVFSGNGGRFEAFASDLDAGIYLSWQDLQGDTRSPVAGLYRLDGLDAARPQQQLLSDPAQPLSPSQGEEAILHHNTFQGASQDLGHVFFQSPFDLTGDGHYIGAAGEFYEYSDGIGVRKVGRIPSGIETECDDIVGTGQPPCEAAPDAEAELPASTDGGGQYAGDMVSADGSHVLFEAPIGSGQIYLREGAHRTFWVNASERTAHEPAAAQPAQAWGTSADGSRIFFTTGESLVSEDEDGGSSDLYMYEVGKPAGSRLTLVSVDPDESPGVSVASFVGSSADGHYVYFVAGGQFVAGEPTTGPAGVGSVNQGLYLWHDGQISYIGQFEDTILANLNTPATSWQESVTKASRVSPDGRHILFTSTNDAGFAGRGGYPGYDHGSCGAFGCRELYLYSAESGRLTCVSCDPAGAHGKEPADALTDVNPRISAAANTQHLSHALSADGEHVFFTTAESLLPEDTNGVADAYEYDVQSGEVRLISSGTDKAPSYFMDASPDGKDVYFDTRQRLVGWDTDQSYDIYDARIGGGFPEPVPVPAACEGEACRPSSRPAPGVSPTSSQSPGPGNPRSKCPKGKVRKHGRCVRKTTRKHPVEKHQPKKHKRANSDHGGGK